MRFPHGDPDAAARAILAKPEFGGMLNSSAVKPQESLQQMLWEWFVDHVLRPLFGPISHAIGQSKGVGAIVGFVVIALALAGLGFVLFRLIVAFVPRGAGRNASAFGARALDGPRASEDWLALARAAAARGEYRTAISALFFAAVASLDASALVVYDAARTPGEYRRLVRRVRPVASPAFDDLTARFVRAAYAETLPGLEDFHAAERVLENLEASVRS